MQIQETFVQTLRRTKATIGDRFARAIWTTAAPTFLRCSLIALVMDRRPGAGWVSRQIDELARRIALAGGAALQRDSCAALKVVRTLENRGAAPFLLVGDSHSRLLAQRARCGRRWLLPLHYLATGASARGLGRVASRSGEGRTLRSFFQATADLRWTVPALFLFGQVDVEFVFVFNQLGKAPSSRAPTDFESFCRETAELYTDFLVSLPGADHSRIVASIFPPALSDESWREGYMNAHIVSRHASMDPVVLKGLLASMEVEPLASRTAQHERFNEILRGVAATRGLAFLDIAGHLPKEGGSVAPRLLGRSGGRDHHLDAREVRTTVVSQLWLALEGSPLESDRR